MAQTGERLVQTNPYVPEAPPAEPDDERVVFLLNAYPEHDARRWVQSMVGWRRKAAEYEAEREQLREALRLALRHFNRTGSPDAQHDYERIVNSVGYVTENEGGAYA